jgi:hypothetical protein
MEPEKQKVLQGKLHSPTPQTPGIKCDGTMFDGWFITWCVDKLAAKRGCGSKSVYVMVGPKLRAGSVY